MSERFPGVYAIIDSMKFWKRNSDMPQPVALPALLCLSLIILWAPVASAERGVPITDKPRPDYDPPKIRVGSLLVMPELKLGLEYNDNIYATKDKNEGDAITTLTPRVQVRTDWANHALGMSTGLTGGLYASATDENYLDGNLSVDGRLDILRGISLSGSIEGSKLHENRGEPDASGAWKQPADYYQGKASLKLTRTAGNVTINTGADITLLDYRSVDLLAGGSEDLDNRDRTLSNLDGRFAYLLLPGVDTFITGGYGWRRYDLEEVGRDSQGYRLGLGTGFDLGGVTTGEVYAGYMRQDYEDRESIDGPWLGLNLLWNVTQLTSVQARVASSVKETTQSGSSGINAIDTGLRADHELLRNLLVGCFFDYTRDDYQGGDILDEYFKVGPRFTYLLNRHLRAEFTYTLNDKESSDPDREYQENKGMFSVVGSL